MSTISKPRFASIFLALSWLTTPALAFDLTVSSQPASLEDDLRSASAVAALIDQDVTPVEIVAAARSDYRRLLGQLYERAYYGADISIRIDGQEVSDLSLLRARSGVKSVEINVVARRPFTFGSADIAPLAEGATPPEAFAIGAPARASIIREAAQDAVADWREAGHAKARIAAQAITANHPSAELRVDMDVNPGPRLRFGALNPPEKGGVRPDRIREIAGLPVGDVFSPAELEVASQRLRRSGVFRSVVLSEAEQINPDQTIDINAELVEAKPRRFGFGAEIGTIEGLSLSGFWMHRNLLGGAERLRFEGEIGGLTRSGDGIDYRLSARFDRPATFTPDTAFFVESEIARLEEPDYKADSVRLETGLSHIFNDQLAGEAAIGYQFADVIDDLGARRLSYLQLPVGLTYDTRDNDLNAKSGVYVDVDLLPFYETRSASTGARLYTDVRTYLTPGGLEQLTTALRLQFGSVVGGSLSDIAPDLLFFSGGAGTVRGQGYQSLAVDLGGGLSAGGRSFVGASAEIRANVSENWSLVAFYDAGFIGEDSFATSNGDWHYGAGVGVRYNTGIGPIRFDVATPVGSGAGSNVEFYIGIGQAF